MVMVVMVALVSIVILVGMMVVMVTGGGIGRCSGIGWCDGGNDRLFMYGGGGIGGRDSIG